MNKNLKKFEKKYFPVPTFSPDCNWTHGNFLDHTDHYYRKLCAYMRFRLINDLS